MLNLFVLLMKKLFFLLPFLFLLLAVQDSPPITISAPRPGEALRGAGEYHRHDERFELSVSRTGFFVRIRPDRDLVSASNPVPACV